MPNPLPWKRHRAPAAFTLVEIMIVVAIIALLSAIALPSFLRARRTSQNARWLNDARVAADAFVMYAAEHGSYPADGFPGTMPAGMEPYFGSRIRWQDPTVFGGRWDWDRGVLGVAAAVSVNGREVSADQLLELDARSDDGDLGTGQLRISGPNWQYVIEE